MQASYVLTRLRPHATPVSTKGTSDIIVAAPNAHRFTPSLSRCISIRSAAPRQGRKAADDRNRGARLRHRYPLDRRSLSPEVEGDAEDVPVGVDAGRQRVAEPVFQQGA